MRQIFVGVLLLFSTILSAQESKTKIEKEYRVNADQVPQKSGIWITEAFPNVSKVKWYSEETSGKKSYEAKLKWQGKKYSVEFSETGDIEDVEIRLNWRKQPDELRKLLQNSFSQMDKFKLLKIQEQWSAADPDVLKAAIQQQNKKKVNLKYEVEFRAVINGVHGHWEGLFDTSGKLLQTRRILTRPTDNLDF